MIKYISQLIFSKFKSYSNDTFYIGKKKIPISIKKYRMGFLVKLGSGFASYTLETTSEELKNLSIFINDFIEKN